MTAATPPVVVTHPLLQDRLTRLRDRRTGAEAFRLLLRQAGLLLASAACRDLKTMTAEIETPLERMDAPRLKDGDPCLISILRAGNGLLDAMLDLLPGAPVGHIGLYRDPVTLEPVEYYLKLPDQVPDRLCIVLDPMLATGNSAAAALQRVREAGARRIRFVCLLAAPEGLRTLGAAHPDIPVFTGAIDRTLDDHAYIRPGLGDAGDRIYGTR